MVTDDGWRPGKPGFPDTKDAVIWPERVTLRGRLRLIAHKAVNSRRVMVSSIVFAVVVLLAGGHAMLPMRTVIAAGVVIAINIVWFVLSRYYRRDRDWRVSDGKMRRRVAGKWQYRDLTQDEAVVLRSRQRADRRTFTALG